jgi:fermentation-respiration switch protein FrsA (DUF1100 family)
MTDNRPGWLAAALSIWALRFGAIYCLLLLWLMAFEETLVHPRGGWYSETPGFEFEEVWLETDDGERLHAWYCPCPERVPRPLGAERPVILFCHGNGGELTMRAPVGDTWQQILGADVFLFDYRGYGQSSGTPTEAGLYRDGESAYRYLTRVRGIPGRRIILLGESIGGGVAVFLAQSHDHRALVIERSFTSLPEAAARIYTWLPVRRLMRNRFPSADRIGRCRRPVFICHGDRDELIPFEHGEQLYQLANPPKHWLPLSGLGHNDPLPRVYFEAVRDFLKQNT